MNPYRCFDVTALTVEGVFVSTDAGASWTRENALTQLITGNGKYALGLFGGGNGSGVEQGSHANTVATLSSMSFDPWNPNHRVAASPYTGVFMSQGDGKWNDMTPLLPKPLAPVSCVTLFFDDICVATEGRGLLKITGASSPPRQESLSPSLERRVREVRACPPLFTANMKRGVRNVPSSQL